MLSAEGITRPISIYTHSIYGICECKRYILVVGKKMVVVVVSFSVYLEAMSIARAKVLGTA